MEKMREINIGLLGCGTVGTGVPKLLLERRDLIASRLGAVLNLKRAADLDLGRDRGLRFPEGVLVADARRVVEEPGIDVVGDTVQLGSDKPYLKAILVFAEQLIRIFFMWILLERFQVTALIIAYFIGLFTKGIVAYLVNNKYCYPQRFFVWQSLAAPFLAGAAHFAFMSWVTQFLWTGDQMSSIAIFFIGVLPSFPIFMFLYGLAGGWDQATLDELAEAASMAGLIRPLAKWGLYAPSAFGARISPLHGRFPITIRADAMAEAMTLIQEKVNL